MAATDVIRRLLPYTTAALVGAAIYAGWAMYSRYSDARAMRQRIEEQERERTIKAGRLVERQYGGDELKILNFTADKGITQPGGRILLCYGVANAATVRIEPEIEPIKPALTHCLEAFPKKPTTYALTAADTNGHTQSASLTIAVR